MHKILDNYLLYIYYGFHLVFVGEGSLWEGAAAAAGVWPRAAKAWPWALKRAGREAVPDRAGGAAGAARGPGLPSP